MNALVAGERFDFRSRTPTAPLPEIWRELDRAIWRWMLAHGADEVTAPEWGVKQGKRGESQFKSPIGTVRKCTFCTHRLERGEEPACCETCIGDARYFGDLNDPESVVAKLAADPRAFRLKEEFGTAPRVYYLR